jgi:hypothetical protein
MHDVIFSVILTFQFKRRSKIRFVCMFFADKFKNGGSIFVGERT